ncbi:hypothetical protein F443_08797 [Phytophthora nicotianae P1569]|uniref:Uncharacterized protein n=2 Tax=Phytophthora nicotianae TaxID=4792 RepID=V9F5V2_PHYNI|nr:hypothetical protein F443_08797 [Phytophthora nicotianae P1569]ETO75561.1 hypothetical protein F444_08866 [Phytophthora nicotianae P1976]
MKCHLGFWAILLRLAKKYPLKRHCLHVVSYNQMPQERNDYFKNNEDPSFPSAEYPYGIMDDRKDNPSIIAWCQAILLHL